MVIDTIETFDVAETIDELFKHINSFAIEVVATGLPDGLTQVAVAATHADMHRVCEVLDLDFEDARVLYDPNEK
jgi:hypothetical protein